MKTIPAETRKRISQRAAASGTVRVPASHHRAAARPDLATRLADEVRQCLRGTEEHGRNGEVVLDREIQGYRLVVVRTATEDEAGRTLSPREIEIARMVAKGHPNKTIAGVLEISSWTVGTHLRRIFAKLGVNSRAAMVTRLMDAGYVDRWAQAAH